jgi:hypothetical protein
MVFLTRSLESPNGEIASSPSGRHRSTPIKTTPRAIDRPDVHEIPEESVVMRKDHFSFAKGACSTRLRGETRNAGHGAPPGGARHSTPRGEVIMATRNKGNRSQQQTGDQQLIDGLSKHASTLPSLTFLGASHPTAAIIAALQARIASANTVSPAKATWQSTVQADRDERAKTKAFVSGLRQALQLVFAGSLEALADFGLKPRKQPAPRTPEQKAAAVAKAKATRAARHTMGPKQKAKVKGAVAQTAPASPPPAAPTLPVTAAPPSPQPK